MLMNEYIQCGVSMQWTIVSNRKWSMLTPATTWMNLVNIRLRERSRHKDHVLYNPTHLKCPGDANLQEVDQWLPKAVGVERDGEWSLKSMRSPVPKSESGDGCTTQWVLKKTDFYTSDESVVFVNLSPWSWLNKTHRAAFLNLAIYHNAFHCLKLSY